MKRFIVLAVLLIAAASVVEAKPKYPCKEKCAAGTFCNSKTKKCETCPAGTYQKAAGKTTCTRCPDKTYADKPGAKSCKKCPLQTNAGAKNCPSSVTEKFPLGKKDLYVSSTLTESSVTNSNGTVVASLKIGNSSVSLSFPGIPGSINLPFKTDLADGEKLQAINRFVAGVLTDIINQLSELFGLTAGRRLLSRAMLQAGSACSMYPEGECWTTCCEDRTTCMADNSCTFTSWLPRSICSTTVDEDKLIGSVSALARALVGVTLTDETVASALSATCEAAPDQQSACLKCNTGVSRCIAKAGLAKTCAKLGTPAVNAPGQNKPKPEKPNSTPDDSADDTETENPETPDTNDGTADTNAEGDGTNGKPETPGSNDNKPETPPGKPENPGKPEDPGKPENPGKPNTVDGAANANGVVDLPEPATKLPEVVGTGIAPGNSGSTPGADGSSNGGDGGPPDSPGSQGQGNLPVIIPDGSNAGGNAGGNGNVNGNGSSSNNNGKKP